jgi:chemotaxis response regulator CheB
MGADGASGMLEIEKAKPGRIVQNEKKSVVFVGPVDQVVPITEFSRGSFR